MLKVGWMKIKKTNDAEISSVILIKIFINYF